MRIKNYTFSYPCEVESRHATACVNVFVQFDYVPADPTVGMDDEICINEVWFQGTGRIDCDAYDKREIETLCREWLSDQREKS